MLRPPGAYRFGMNEIRLLFSRYAIELKSEVLTINEPANQ